VSLALLVAVPLISKPKESAIGFAVMLSTGVAYYLLVITWTSKPAVLVNKMGTLTTIVCREVFNDLHATQLDIMCHVSSLSVVYLVILTHNR